MIAEVIVDIAASETDRIFDYLCDRCKDQNTQLELFDGYIIITEKKS